MKGMRAKSTRLLGFLMLVTFFVRASGAFAQQPAAPAAGAGATSSAGPFDARDTVGTILLAGLVGGVLGLSTLSFYDNPQDNIRNITIGAGAGMIIAALALTFQIASNPSKPTAEYRPPPVQPLIDNGYAGLQLATRF